MRLLWVTTKPPWPTLDGGRLVAARTLEALAGAGCAIEVLSPRVARADPPPAGVELTLVEARPLDLAFSLPRAWLTRRAVSVVRHALPAVSAAVAARLARPPAIDVVVAEQLQALAQCQAARPAGLPLVLRAQNVESELWAELARQRPAWRLPLRREARLLRAAEGAALLACQGVLALSARDAQQLGALAPDAQAAARVHHVAAPFPAELPAADDALAGAPAVVLFGGAGWLPNTAGAAWFARDVWPTLRQALPEARLHVFGKLQRDAARQAGPGVQLHAAPADSRVAFARQAVLAVPVHVASGVRLRILEGWARGLPVVATPEAAAGLDAEDGRELLLARDAAEFVIALRRLADPEVRSRLVGAGRARLRASHDPVRVATRLVDVFTSLARAAAPHPPRPRSG